jgi:hypothetical protein
VAVCAIKGLGQCGQNAPQNSARRQDGGPFPAAIVSGAQNPSRPEPMADK